MNQNGKEPQTTKAKQTTQLEMPNQAAAEEEKNNSCATSKTAESVTTIVHGQN